jgi:hypothetical protein
MAFNNNLLFNAAVNGFMEGVNSGSELLDSTAADYSNQTLAAVAFGTAVDTAIAHDTSISGGAGVTLPPTTAAITANQYAKVAAVFGLSKAVMSGRKSNTYDVTSADYTSVADGIEAAYTEIIAAMTANSSLA